MKFIKLTLNDGRSIFINPEKITDIIEKKDKTNGSFVSCGENNTADVKETAEEIVQQIESLFIEIRSVDIEELKLKDIELIEDYLNMVELKYNVLKVNENWRSVSIDKGNVLVSFMFCNDEFVNLLVHKDNKMIMDKNRNDEI